MGWYITLGILLLLAILPVGVRLRYDAEGLAVKVIAGPVKIPVFPLKKKEKTGNKEKKQKKKTGTAPSEQAEPLPKPPAPPSAAGKEKSGKKDGGSLLDFLPLVQVALDFLGDFRRKLRLNDLYLRLILAGEDPCDLAVNYGRAWAAMGNLTCALEKWFVIKKRDLEVECDFAASETLVTARLDMTIAVGRLLAAVVRFAVRALTEYLKIKKKRKGGAVK